MSAGEFETRNWGWQWQQLQQQGGEWLELKGLQLAPRGLPPLGDGWNFSRLGELRWLFEGAGVLFVAIALWLLAKALGRWWARRLYTTQSPKPGPELAAPSVKEWLARSRQEQRQGNYRAACRSLYMAMLQRLQDRQTLPNPASCTDGEYRQILQQQTQYPAYNVLLDTHERLYFGEGEATPETVRQCEQAYREIQEEP